MSKHRVPMYFYPSLRKLKIPFIDRESDSYRFLLSIKCINMTTMMLVRAVELDSATPQDQSHRSCGVVGFRPLNRLWAQLSLVVIIVLFYGREKDDVARAEERSGVGWAGTAASVDRVVPVCATVVNMSDHGRVGGPRSAQLDNDYKVWAAYRRAQLKKEKL